MVIKEATTYRRTSNSFLHTLCQAPPLKGTPPTNIIMLKTNLSAYEPQSSSNEQNRAVELVLVALCVALLLDMVVVRGERRKGGENSASPRPLSDLMCSNHAVTHKLDSSCAVQA